MGLFRGYCESLMAVLLCSLMCNELVCNATNSWPLNGERRDSFSESTISIKMPGTRPLEVRKCLSFKLYYQDIFCRSFDLAEDRSMDSGSFVVVRAFLQCYWAFCCLISFV